MDQSQGAPAGSRRLLVVVGSGFTSALTGGECPALGHTPLPTLAGLTDSLFSYMQELQHTGLTGPFANTVFSQSLAALRRNVERPEAERYSFEEFLSLLAIGSSIARGVNASVLTELPGSNPEILRCMLYSLSEFFVSRLAHNCESRANRNFWYQVNDTARAAAMKEGLWWLVDNFATTFASFNYDGLIEAFLDFWLGQDRGFRYSVGVSHGIPLTAPENVNASRPLGRLPTASRLPTVLKPHGSMHFFQLRQEFRSFIGGPSIAAVHPRLDLGFNSNTSVRDVPDVPFWRFADPVPLIIPPILNKEGYFGGDYFQVLLRLLVDAVQEADCVLVLGFSLPASDLHVCAAFETVDWANKPVGLVFRSGLGDQTEQRWRRVAGSGKVTILSDLGLPTSSVSAIEGFWESIGTFLRSAYKPTAPIGMA